MYIYVYRGSGIIAEPAEIDALLVPDQGNVLPPSQGDALLNQGIFENMVRTPFYMTTSMIGHPLYHTYQSNMVMTFSFYYGYCLRCESVLYTLFVPHFLLSIFHNFASSHHLEIVSLIMFFPIASWYLHGRWLPT